MMNAMKSRLVLSDVEWVSNKTPNTRAIKVEEWRDLNDFPSSQYMTQGCFIGRSQARIKTHARLNQKVLGSIEFPLVEGLRHRAINSI